MYFEKANIICVFADKILNNMDLCDIIKEKGGIKMGISYKPLWNKLVQYDMNKTEFRQSVGLSTSTLSKLSANEKVSTDILFKICDYFGCGLDSIVTYESPIEAFMKTLEPYIIEWKYELRLNKWPKFYFRLQPQQVIFLQQLGNKELNKNIQKIENLANCKCYPNAGILNSTKYELIGNCFILEGSFAVIEILLPWIIEHTKIKK